MQHPILLNDILRLPTQDDHVKAKFCKYNNEDNPIDTYLDDPNGSIDKWLNWRGKYSDLFVGQTALLFMRLPD